MSQSKRSRQEKSRQSRSKDLWWFLLIVGLSFLIRSIHLLQVQNRLFFNFFSDFQFYSLWAQDILQGRAGPPVYFFGPLYPHLLALLWGLFGRSQIIILWFQVLIGSLSCGLVSILGWQVFDRKVGLLAGVLAIFYAAEIFYEGVLLMATTLYFLHLLLLVSIFWVIRRQRWYYWVIPGILLGLSAIGRANILAFLPFLLFGIVIHTARSGKKRGRQIRAIVALLLGVLFVIAPVTLHNVLIGHDMVLISSNLGMNFFIGNNSYARGIYEKPKGLKMPEDISGSKIAELLEGRTLTPSGVSRFWLRKAWDFIRTQPGTFLHLTLNKMIFFWNAYEIPQVENMLFFKRFAPVLRWPLLNFGILGPLGLLGVAISIRQWRSRYFLLSFLFSFMVSTVFFFILARLRLQVCSVLMVFAAFALVWLWRKIKSKRLIPIALAIGTLVLFALLVNRPHPAFDPPQDEARAQIVLGKYLWQVQKNPSGAAREFERALTIDPHLGQTYLYLAMLEIEQGHDGEAVHLWQRALQADPLISAAHMNVGHHYAQQGNWEKAILEYQAEIKNSPYRVTAYQALSRAIMEREKIGASDVEG